MNPTTDKAIAEFMKAELDKSRMLYQEDIADQISRRFGEPFVYTNENGNLAISKGVLKEFRKLTPYCVWERGDKCWRMRERGDDSQKRVQD